MFKLLAVDVPSAAGPEQRIYLEGDERIYNRGSVMRELRDPFLNVRTHHLLVLLMQCGAMLVLAVSNSLPPGQVDSPWHS